MRFVESELAKRAEDQASREMPDSSNLPVPSQPDSEKGNRLVSYGAELVGAAAGGAIGATFGPEAAVAGAAAGGVASKFVSNVFGDVANRVLSHFEHRRLAKAAYRINATINKNLEDGMQPRQDEATFREDDQGRSAATEILEGVLLKCQREYDEKKTAFIEKIYSNFLFHPEISPDAAYSLLNIVDRLSYRQFCLVALLGQAAQYRIDPNSLRYSLQSTTGHNTLTPFLRQELNDLGNYGFFDERQGDSAVYLGTLGNLAFSLMSLNEIPADELRHFRSFLP